MARLNRLREETGDRQLDVHLCRAYPVFASGIRKYILMEMHLIYSDISSAHCRLFFTHDADDPPRPNIGGSRRGLLVTLKLRHSNAGEISLALLASNRDTLLALFNIVRFFRSFKEMR